MGVVMVRSKTLAGLVLALALPLAGCDWLPFGYTPINQVTGQGATFEGKVVKLRGKVVDVSKIPVLDIAIYTLRDDTGQIVVTRPAELPKVGEEIALRGQVENLIILAGQGMGTTVQELDRLPVFPSFKP